LKSQEEGKTRGHREAAARHKGKPEQTYNLGRPKKLLKKERHFMGEGGTRGIKVPRGEKEGKKFALKKRRRKKSTGRTYTGGKGTCPTKQGKKIILD